MQNFHSVLFLYEFEYIGRFSNTHWHTFNIVLNLKIPTNHNYDTDFLVTNDQVANTLNKFRNHPSIFMTKNKRKTDQCFSFGPVTYDVTLKNK